MTTGGHPYPFRIACRFEKKDGFIVLDQIRTVDRRRLVKRLGRLTIKDCFHTLSAVACGVEGSESVETISWAEPLRGGWGYGD